MNVISRSGDRMSSRARGYLTVAVFHFGLIGASIIWAPELYEGSAFLPLITYTHLFIWGVGYMIVAACCAVAVLTKWPQFARGGLILAFVVLFVSSFAVAWGVVSSWTDANPGNSASPVVPLTFMALALKDLLMVGRPLNTPFEDYMIARGELSKP